ncbi:hypothetical protein [Taibaiella helva]|uniref:hypothetical protein n=1 Tax=Taibaiella helva TaxID=2301235 RepID=UPI000E59529B|nr:hypothetical protein [Taibaiella helva]
MKKLLLAAILCSGFNLKAQDLAYKIPQAAVAVASVKGAQFLELCTVGEFNNSVLGKKLAEGIKKEGKGTQYSGIEDLGLQLQGTAYYYYLPTDSISYNCLLFPLGDVSRFEHILGSAAKRIERKGTTRSLYDHSENTLLLWNDQTALLVVGSLKLSYFDTDSLRAAHYGIKRVNYGDYYRDEYTADAFAADTVVAAAADSAWNIAAGAAPASGEDAVAVDEDVKVAEYIPGPVATDTAGIIEPPAAIDIAAPTVVEAPPMVVAEVAQPSYYDQEAYNRDYEAQKKIQDRLTRDWLSRYAASAFEKTSGPSVLDNPDFLRSQDKNAAATFYLSGMQNLYNSFSTPLYPAYRFSGLGNLLQGYGSINAKFYLEKEKAYINTEMMLEEGKAAAYKKIYAHKPNKQFARYINSDKLVGFMSYSFDTEHYLQELPDLLRPAFSQYLGIRYGEETSIGADLFSLLLDEKAVAKVIKGDAVVLFTDIGPKEYTYTTYEYNDDYERKEVTKTKTETVPDFLFMMSSDDPRIIERLLNYGVHKERITLKNGIYSFDDKLTGSSPFRLHMLIKDGIVFCGTAYRDIQQIAAGTYQGNISKEQKDLLLKNNMALYFNPKSMIGKLPRDEFGGYRKLEALNTLLGNTGPMYARTTGIKGNRISGELVAQVPGNKENALKYFLSMIEYATKLD